MKNSLSDKLRGIQIEKDGEKIKKVKKMLDI
jgi:hypothetical protein